MTACAYVFVFSKVLLKRLEKEGNQNPEELKIAVKQRDRKTIQRKLCKLSGKPFQMLPRNPMRQNIKRNRRSTRRRNPLAPCKSLVPQMFLFLGDRYPFIVVFYSLFNKPFRCSLEAST